MGVPHQVATSGGNAPKWVALIPVGLVYRKRVTASKIQIQLFESTEYRRTVLFRCNVNKKKSQLHKIHEE